VWLSLDRCWLMMKKAFKRINAMLYFYSSTNLTINKLQQLNRNHCPNLQLAEGYPFRLDPLKKLALPSCL